jgi:hypothetical protein
LSYNFEPSESKRYQESFRSQGGGSGLTDLSGLFGFSRFFGFAQKEKQDKPTNPLATPGPHKTTVVVRCTKKNWTRPI